MKLARIYIALCLIVGLVIYAVPTFAAGKAEGSGHAPDRILVKFKDGVDSASKQRVHAEHGGRVVDVIEQLDVQVVEISGRQASEIARAYQAERAVEYAEPDFTVKATGVPNDPDFDNQWGLTNSADADIDAPEAWGITTGAPEVAVAILDSGVDQDHEDLAAKIVANENFTTSGTVDDLLGHGTHVAGIAAATTNNGIGIAGVGYDCSIMNIKVLGDDGSGYTSWVANGIIYAADSGAKVINMSFGGSSSSKTLSRAVDYAWDKGAVLVAAAGNSSGSKKEYPASYANCIAVAATDQNDNKAYFSNFGKWVDVAAPGVRIYSTLPNHSNHMGTDYGYLDGTSMATPHVAGLAGLVWATGYGTSNLSVRSRIESTADRAAAGDIYSKYRIPRINAFSAVAQN